MTTKLDFENQLKGFVAGLQEHISTKDGQWTVKGFIDVYKNVYTISSDTKIVSKILEIHLFPKILEFAKQYAYKVVLADHQNYYPDISFVKSDDEKRSSQLILRQHIAIQKNCTFVMALLSGLTGNTLKTGAAKRTFNSLIIHTAATSAWESSTIE